VKILLLSPSSVIYRLIEIGTEGVEREIAWHKNCQKFPEGHYDIAFVDDKACQELPESGEFGQMVRNIAAHSKILFTSDSSRETEGIDGLIEKPFLPSSITKVIREFVEERGHQREDTITPSILDPNDISEIRRLLIEDAKALSPEGNFPEAIGRLIDEENRRETTQAEEQEAWESTKMSEKVEEDMNIAHDNPLVEAILQMKPKKLRQLLKGAKITIKIKFPKGDEQ